MSRTTLLENERIRVSIDALGAELSGLLDKHDGVEHMWCADPAYWPRKAPILFPCVGESRNGRILVNGMRYTMERHGFARTQWFRLANASSHQAVFELIENEQTLRHFPFHFLLRITFSIQGSSLEQQFEIVNTGSAKLGFQVGGHPAFAVPFHKKDVLSDYVVGFDRPMLLDRHLLNGDGLYSGETRNVLNQTSTIPLHEKLFDEDALVFKNTPSKRVWIGKLSGGKRLQVDLPGFPHLGIWSKPGAPFVCLEPWVGCADQVDQPDDFWTKDNLTVLQPGERFVRAFRISLIDP